MKYIQSAGGYYYKQYKNGKKVRISKKVYSKKKGGEKFFRDAVLYRDEDKYPGSKFKIDERVICHSDKCYKKIKKNIETEKQENYKTSVLTIEEIYYDNKKYTYKVSGTENTSRFEENDLTRYIQTSKTKLNLNDNVWNYENSDPNRKEFIVFAHGSECFQDSADNDSVIKKLSSKYSKYLQNLFTKKPVYLQNLFTKKPAYLQNLSTKKPVLRKASQFTKTNIFLTEYLMKVFNIYQYFSKEQKIYEMIFDAHLYMTFGCQEFFGKGKSESRFLSNYTFKAANFAKNLDILEGENWEEYSRVLNFFPRTLKMETIYAAFQVNSDSNLHQIRPSVMNKKNYMQLSKIYNMLKYTWNNYEFTKERVLELVKDRIDKENKENKESYWITISSEYQNFFPKEKSVCIKGLTINDDQEKIWREYLSYILRNRYAIEYIKKLRTLSFKLLRDVPLLPNEKVIIKCEPGCTLIAPMGKIRVQKLKDATNLKDFLTKYKYAKIKQNLCVFKGSVPNLNLQFYQNKDKKNVGGFGLYELPLSDKWCLKDGILVHCTESSNDDKLYWQTENSYLNKGDSGANSDIAEVIKKIREKYKDSEIILYINSCRIMRLCSVEKDKETGSYSVKKI